MRTITKLHLDLIQVEESVLDAKLPHGVVVVAMSTSERWALAFCVMKLGYRLFLSDLGKETWQREEGE